MVDTHSHILWGIDDGPQSRGEALAVCANAAADGVRSIIATPHVSRRFPTTYAAAAARLAELSHALAYKDLPIRLGLGGEITAGLVASLPSERLREWSIGGRYLLVEVDDSWARRTPGLMSSILASAGLTPVWAHPERWRTAEHDPGVVRALASSGLVQVTAPSLLGLVGKRARAAAWRMIEDGTAGLVASDVHGTKSRPQNLGEAARAVGDQFGPEVCRRLFFDAPDALIAGGPPESIRSGVSAPTPVS